MRNKKCDVKFIPKAVDGGLKQHFDGIDEECLSHDGLVHAAQRDEPCPGCAINGSSDVSWTDAIY